MTGGDTGTRLAAAGAIWRACCCAGCAACGGAAPAGMDPRMRPVLGSMSSLTLALAAAGTACTGVSCEVCGAAGDGGAAAADVVVVTLVVDPSRSVVVLVMVAEAPSAPRVTLELPALANASSFLIYNNI